MLCTPWWRCRGGERKRGRVTRVVCVVHVVFTAVSLNVRGRGRGQLHAVVVQLLAAMPCREEVSNVDFPTLFTELEEIRYRIEPINIFSFPKC